ncbi:MAG: S41 family peptidase, partial [Mogibacterium sp.]|nr:S41 family peptidase [Mogibacterium sp.]
NGGGLTDESIEIADYLLPACKIMSEVSKNGEENVSNSKSSSADLDMVILTDSDTASASEILTGALQDNKAGLIIGEKTYGKGVTQLSRKFDDGSAVKLTITEYFRPNGETVNEKGITPDIKVSSDKALERGLEELAK